MKRYLAWFFLLFLAPATLLNAAEQSEYDEGINYQRLAVEQPAGSDGNVEVVELFWYGCPHCYHFEPFIKQWLKKKPAKVTFIRIPAIFNNEIWKLHATAFYTAEVLGIGEKIHGDLFDAIHKQHRAMSSRDELMKFFAGYGVSNDDFNATFDSFTVQTKVQRAADLSRKYEATGVPTLIINGKYRLDGPMAGSYENMVKILDFLVRKELKETAKK